MALQLERKQEIVAEVNEAAGRALSAVLADYRGLNVAEMTDLRRRARDAGVTLRIVRNTLLRRAVEGTEYECLREAASGPTLLALSNEDPGAAARLLRDAVREHERLDVKAVAIGGRVYGAGDIDRVASLPTRDQAVAMLMSAMLAPVGKVVHALGDIPARLARTLAAVGGTKEDE